MNPATENRDSVTAPMLNKSTMMKGCSNKLKQYVATTSVSLGAFCAGTVLSWTSPAFAHILKAENATGAGGGGGGPPGFTITEAEGALVGATLTIGALAAALPVGYCAQRFGRKPTILSLAVPFLVNWLLVAFARNAATLVAARFLAGVGLGGVCVTAPMYIAEIAEARSRGAFGSFFQMFLCAGILFTCLVGAAADWTWLAAVLGCAPPLFAAAFFFQPETPVHLLGRGLDGRAEQTLRALRGGGDVSDELKALAKEIKEAREKSATLREVVTDRANLKAVVSVLGVLAFQQLSGINAVVFYTVPIFSAAGTSLSPAVAGIVVNLVQVIVSYVSILIVEKADRRVYLISSSVGMFLCLSGLGMFFQLKGTAADVSVVSYLPVICTVLFMICFSFGYGPVPFMLMGELFSPEIKGIASGMAVLTNWACAFLVTYFFPISNSAFGEHVTFYVFSGAMALATLFVLYVVPETRGKSLAEIQQALNR